MADTYGTFVIEAGTIEDVNTRKALSVAKLLRVC